VKKTFTTISGVKISAELMGEILGCQRFKITTKGYSPRLITLAGTDTSYQFKILKIYLTSVLLDFNELGPWTDSIATIGSNLISS